MILENKQRALLMVCTLLLTPPRMSSAQTIRDFEQHVKSIFSRFEYLGRSDSSSSSLDSINDGINDYLRYTLPKIPQTLTSSMDLPAGLIVTSSLDHKVRAWSWDITRNALMPPTYTLMEFETPYGIKTDFLDDSGVGSSLCDTIYTIRTKSGSTIYLPIFYMWSTNLVVGEVIEAFSITKDILEKHIKLFQTPKELLQSIGIYYNSSTNFEGKSANHIRISSDGNTLLIPVVKPYGKDYYGDHMTSKSLRYDFDGEHFVYKGLTK